MSITESFNKQPGEKEEGFTITYFKRLLLDFIVNNNISFRVVTTPSFKKFIKYLN
jgi:Zn-dependent M16 (insulinase) family peptidase